MGVDHQVGRDWHPAAGPGQAEEGHLVRVAGDPAGRLQLRVAGDVRCNQPDDLSAAPLLRPTRSELPQLLGGQAELLEVGEGEAPADLDSGVGQGYEVIRAVVERGSRTHQSLTFCRGRQRSAWSAAWPSNIRALRIRSRSEASWWRAAPPPASASAPSW